MRRICSILGLFLLFLPSTLSADSVKLPSQQQIDKASHLLKRATFGPRPEEIIQLAEKGEGALRLWVEEQLKPNTISDTEVDKKLQRFKSLSMNNQQLATTFLKPKKNQPAKKNKEGTQNPPKQILMELIAQKFIRSVESKRQLQEVLVDFWFNHFNVDFRKGQTKWLITSYERDVIRPHVFGKFSDLLMATARSPAMLFYLDNAQSVKSGFASSKGKKNTKSIRRGINENYARELMELHTLGVNGGYTQKDVAEVARILTGWTIDRKDEALKFVFKPSMHDQGSKEVMNIHFPAKGGEAEGIQLLQMLAKHPSTARNIAFKLAQRFISDDPPKSIVDKLSKIFTTTDGDLSALYRELFISSEFWSSRFANAKIKKPFHWEVSMIRAVGGKIEIDGDQDIHQLDAPIEQMGEAIYRCQPPTGFKDSAQFWVNAGALVTRMNFALRLSRHRVNAVTFSSNYFRSSIQKAGLMGKNDESIKYLDRMIMGSALKESTIQKISTELNADPLVQEEAEVTRSEKMRNSINMKKILGLVLGSPEFQRF